MHACIRKASAILVASFLRWILALKKKKRNEIKSLPKETWKQVKPLLEPFRKDTLDEKREALLREVVGYPYEIHRLAQSEGLDFYKDYKNILKWAKELRTVESLKATKSMTRGAREPRIGPKR